MVSDTPRIEVDAYTDLIAKENDEWMIKNNGMDKIKDTSLDVIRKVKSHLAKGKKQL